MEEIIGITEKKMAKASGKELENKINTFCILIANLKRDMEDTVKLLKDELDTIYIKTEDTLKNFEKKEQQRIRQYINNFFEEYLDTNPKDFKEKMQKMVIEEIAKGFVGFRKNEEKVILEGIQESVDRFLKRSNNILHEFRIAAEILFEVSIGEFEFFLEPTRDNDSHYKIQKYTTPPTEGFEFILRAFLPEIISRKLVMYTMVDKMITDISQNCCRIRSRLTARISTIIYYCSKQLVDLENNLVNQVEQAIQRCREKITVGSKWS